MRWPGEYSAPGGGRHSPKTYRVAAPLLLAVGFGCQTEEPAHLPSVPSCEVPSTVRSPMRLLTRSEYDNTIRDLLGDDSKPSRHFPPEPDVGGFDNNVDSHLANPLLVERFGEAAHAVAQRAVQERGPHLAPCPEDAGAVDCGQSFVTEFGKRAFRRPLTNDERDSFVRLYQKAQPSLGHQQAVALVIEAMLQSPQFLYRIEAPLTFPKDASAKQTVPLGPYEVASRLSYFIWGSMPDDELFAAAERNELDTAARLEAQARRLLDNPRAHARVSKFHEHWLGLKRFETVVRDEVESQPNDSWRRSILAFVNDVFWSDSATVADLFTSRTVYVDEALSRLYDVASSAEISGSSLVPVELEAARAGLLTQPGLMAMLAHPNQSSPIQRGVFVREHILCRPVQSPPPTVNVTPPDPDPTATTRERFAQHTEDPVCSSCHALIDPLGFGFEQFDELGRYRETEHGLPVDASGKLLLSPDPRLDGPFDGPAELSRRLATSPVIIECLARHWYRFALGRLETAEDACTLEQVSVSVQRAGGRLDELLVALVRSDAFRQRAIWTEEVAGKQP